MNGMGKYEMINAEMAREKKEIAELDFRAREYEAWFLANPGSPDFFKVNSKYADVLFKLAQKKEKAETPEGGPWTKNNIFSTERNIAQ